MSDALNFDLLYDTFYDLSIGVGIFQVPDLNDIRSIRYVFMNKIILYEMRKEREEVFGKKILEVAPEAFEHEGGLLVMETYRKVAAEGGSINLGVVEYSNHMVAGKYECSVHHIKENFVYVMLRNVTELEQTKNQLELKNKELNQFAYIVSHDLKSPLNTITGFVNLIETKWAQSLHPKAKEVFSYIVGATQRMEKVITDILDYSGIGAKKNLGEIDCKKLLENTVKDLAADIQKANAQIELGELPKIKGYETELRMLFQNLISNAIKFRNPSIPPKISIYAEEKDGWTFYIKDNGIGIAEKDQGKIFSVFQRLHPASEYEGTGIGLAHCKKIVELHKGSIGVESELGKGTTFYFSIPKL